MIIFIENLIYYFDYGNILLFDTKFYYLSYYKLKKILQYSKILEIKNPENINELNIIVDDYFEIIVLNIIESQYYVGCLINLLINNWNNYKFKYLLNKYNDYINFLDKKNISNNEYLIYFIYIVKNINTIKFSNSF